MATPNSIAKAAAAFGGLDDRPLRQAMVYLLAQILGTNMTPNQIANASSCYCGDDKALMMMAVYLLSQILANGGTGGGGSGLSCGNYAGAQPTFTPTTSCANAIDTSNGRVWYYFNSAWH